MIHAEMCTLYVLKFKLLTIKLGKLSEQNSPWRNFNGKARFEIP